jgi:dTDP-4-dehydrorhamnose 3,5-epimerase
MNVIETRLPGVLILEPRVFRDARGFFMETWNRARYEALGLPGGFVQDNLSCSSRGVLRGLHYQHPRAQGKLVTVLAGEVYDVAVDIRRGSPTFTQWVGVYLSGENKRALYVPPGFAHGFLVTSETALFGYKCTEYYFPQDEASVLWNDPELGIDWPSGRPTLSAKDEAAPRLGEVPLDRLPIYEEGDGSDAPGRPRDGAGVDRSRWWIANQGSSADVGPAACRVPRVEREPRHEERGSYRNGAL